MKKAIIYYAFTVALLSCMGCSTEKKMYRNMDASGDISLTYYTGMPSLGPCGFARNMNSYDIETPRTKGKIQSNELLVTEYPNMKVISAGYIEFIKDNVVDIELYTKQNGEQAKLAIDGLHKIKVINNTIDGKRI